MEKLNVEYLNDQRLKFLKSFIKNLKETQRDFLTLQRDCFDDVVLFIFHSQLHAENKILQKKLLKRAFFTQNYDPEVLIFLFKREWDEKNILNFSIFQFHLRRFFLKKDLNYLLKKFSEEDFRIKNIILKIIPQKLKEINLKDLEELFKRTSDLFLKDLILKEYKKRLKQINSEELLNKLEDFQQSEPENQLIFIILVELLQRKEIREKIGM